MEGCAFARPGVADAQERVPPGEYLPVLITMSEHKKTSEVLLKVNDLHTWFRTAEGVVKAVDGVSFSIEKGKMVALVGESGCGKSVTALSLARLSPEPPACYANGQILFNGNDILRMTPKRLRTIRGSGISYIFQEPTVSLNPVVPIKAQIMESLRLHRPEAANGAEVDSLLSMVGIPESNVGKKKYPHEFSGGMQQRIMIAIALAPKPDLLVADEPTTALDVTVQGRILDLIQSLRKQRDMGILLITHNLGLTAEYADTIHVMYAGKIVESGIPEALIKYPKHPYTQGLLASIPRLLRTTGEQGGRPGGAPGEEKPLITGVPGAVPSAVSYPSGCRFHPRCRYAEEICKTREPVTEPSGDCRTIRCHRWKELEREVVCK